MKGGLVGMGIGLVRGGGRRVAPVPPVVVAEGEGIGWKRVDRSLRRPIKQHTENLNEYRRNTQFYS